MKKLGRPHPSLPPFVVASWLSPLCDILYEYTDLGLVLGFVERWHPKTNTFHLPIGEMTITSDDVWSLLHLPITGSQNPFKKKHETLWNGFWDTFHTFLKRITYFVFGKKIKICETEFMIRFKKVWNGSQHSFHKTNTWKLMKRISKFVPYFSETNFEFRF